MNRRRTPRNARARHARIRASEPDRITDALDRLEAHYNAAQDGETLAVLAAAYDWLRALVKLAAREVDPEGEKWAEDQVLDAVLMVADVARVLAGDIRDEAGKLRQPLPAGR